MPKNNSDKIILVQFLQNMLKNLEQDAITEDELHLIKTFFLKHISNTGQISDENLINCLFLGFIIKNKINLEQKISF